MNLLNSLRVFGKDSWSLKSSSKLPADFLAKVDHATVVDSKFGASVCFFLKGGGFNYIPVANDSTLGIGDTVELTSVDLLVLQKADTDDILRIK